LTAIVKLLAQYLSVRDGDLVMPSSMQAMIGPTDFEFDAVLTEALEGISALHKAAIRGGDVQLSQQVLEALEFLALQSINVKSLFARPDENPTTAFILAYLSIPTQEGAVRGLDDVVMSGARAQTNIAKALLEKHNYLTVRSCIDDIEKLAHLAILQRKAHVTGIPVTGIGEILRLALTRPIAHKNTIHAGLDALQRICVAELQFESSPFAQNLRFAIGGVLDISQPTALSNLESEAIQGLSVAIEERNMAKANEYRQGIEELNDGLWRRFVSIGTAAAKTGSLALFDINSNISEIVKHCLWLLQLLKRTRPEVVDKTSTHAAWLDDRFADDITNKLEWIVGATYWRIFDALRRPISRNIIWEFFPTLSHIGIQALDAGVPSLAVSAISELKSMSLKAVETPIETLQTAARMATFIAKVGIVAQKQEEPTVLQASIIALKEFQNTYFAKQRELDPMQKAMTLPS
jgi:hypothetical protein